jgi:hypothetical protein
MTSRPPLRSPKYVAQETYGWSRAQGARSLIWVLTSFVSPEVRFGGSAAGRAWIDRHSDDAARIAFTTDQGDGSIDLSVDGSDWVKIEVFSAGACVLCAWCDEPWEEKEFWPDGSDGLTPPDGDAPGRISKRGSWLQIKCAMFPGVPNDGTGYWTLEIPEQAPQG